MGNLFNSTQYKTGSIHFGLLLLRLISVMMLINHGLPKVLDFTGHAAHFYDPLNWGGEIMLIFTIFAEVVCAFLVVIGLFTRWAAAVLIFEMIITTFFVHGADTFAGRELDLHYLILYIVILLLGPGKHSIDRMLSGR